MPPRRQVLDRCRSDQCPCASSASDLPTRVVPVAETSPRIAECVEESPRHLESAALDVVWRPASARNQSSPGAFQIRSGAQLPKPLQARKAFPGMPPSRCRNETTNATCCWQGERLV